MPDEIKVFISYAREDYETAKRLYDDLKAVTGVTPWMDKIDLLPGHMWRVEVEKAINPTTILIMAGLPINRASRNHSFP